MTKETPKIPSRRGKAEPLVTNAAPVIGTREAASSLSNAQWYDP